MTMMTVAGPVQNGPQQADDIPRNRAIEALEAAGDQPPAVLNADPFDEDMACYELALAIRRHAHLLPVRERTVLAAALLPEFDGPVAYGQIPGQP